jgi:hypothetical protein
MNVHKSALSRTLLLWICAVSIALLLSVQIAVAFSVSDYFTLGYQIILSTSQVNEGQPFNVVASGSATLKAALPISVSSAIIEGRIVATNQATGTKVTLNSDYTLTIAPFPNKVGQTTQLTQTIPLNFPAGSPAGSYTVVSELINAKVDAIIWIDASGYFPSSQTIGTVNYVSASVVTTTQPPQTSTTTSPIITTTQPQQTSTTTSPIITTTQPSQTSTTTSPIITTTQPSQTSTTTSPIITTTQPSQTSTTTSPIITTSQPSQIITTTQSGITTAQPQQTSTTTSLLITTSQPSQKVTTTPSVTITAQTQQIAMVTAPPLITPAPSGLTSVATSQLKSDPVSNGFNWWWLVSFMVIALGGIIMFLIVKRAGR